MSKNNATYSIDALCEAFALTARPRTQAPGEILGVCGLSDNMPHHLSFVTDTRLIEEAAQSDIETFVVPAGLDVPGKCNLEAADPELAIAEIAALFSQPPIAQEESIHASAIIGPGCELAADVMLGPQVVIGREVHIGARSRIEAGAVICDRVHIGEDCVVHANAVVREDCRLGHRVILQPNATIGGDGFGYVTRNGHHQRIPQVGHVVLEDDVEVGANSTIDRGRFSATVVRSGTKIDNLVMIGHNCQIGEDCLIVSQVGISGSTRLGKRVVLAGQVGVAGHIELVDDVVALGMTMVSNSIREPGVYAGHPARPVALWRRAVAMFWQNARRAQDRRRGTD